MNVMPGGNIELATYKQDHRNGLCIIWSANSPVFTAKIYIDDQMKAHLNNLDAWNKLLSQDKVTVDDLNEAQQRYFE